MIIDLIWVFITGLAGSLHCLGMCGPLVLAYSLNQTGTGKVSTPGQALLPSGLKQHALFQGGRIVTYSLLGGLAAGLVRLGNFTPLLQEFRTIIAVSGGLLMVILGLVVLRIVTPGFGSLDSLPYSSVTTRLAGRYLYSRRPVSRLVLGCATGFLPCMFSWAMIIKAALTGDVFLGFATMLFFGLGTAPALLFTGLFASLFSLRLRLAGERIASMSIIAMGLILIWKGVMNSV